MPRTRSAQTLRRSKLWKEALSFFASTDYCHLIESLANRTNINIKPSVSEATTTNKPPATHNRDRPTISIQQSPPASTTTTSTSTPSTPHDSPAPVVKQSNKNILAQRSTPPKSATTVATAAATTTSGASNVGLSKPATRQSTSTVDDSNDAFDDIEIDIDESELAELEALPAANSNTNTSENDEDEEAEILRQMYEEETIDDASDSFDADAAAAVPPLPASVRQGRGKSRLQRPTSPGKNLEPVLAAAAVPDVKHNNDDDADAAKTVLQKIQVSYCA